MFTKAAQSKEILDLILSIDKKMAPIQQDLDFLNQELQCAMRAIHDIQDKIKEVKPLLVPYAEMKASIASDKSRARYFPGKDKTQLSEVIRLAL